jgi:YegS/Rv2252/BmrU family lipid kinase
LKLLLIYNSNAGGKRAGKVLPEVEKNFRDRNLETDLRLTDYSWQGIEILRDIDLSAYDGVVSSGGDGTLFEVINGYMQNDGQKKPPIGIIPNGTGNAFAKEINLKSFEWEKAIDIIAGKKIRKIDVAQFTTEGKKYFYINMLGVGWSADVARTVTKLKSFGEVSYLLGVLYHILFLKSFNATIEIDGKKIEHEAIFIQVGNTVYTGSNFVMSPDAVVDDGFLDIIVVNKLSRLRILKLLPTVFRGKHVLEKEVDVFKGKKIHILTDSPKSIVTDGEVFGNTPMEVECLPQAIPVFWI